MFDYVLLKNENKILNFVDSMTVKTNRIQLFEELKMNSAIYVTIYTVILPLRCYPLSFSCIP